MARGRSVFALIGMLDSGALASGTAHGSASRPPVIAQNEAPSDADLLFRAMTTEPRGSAGMTDNEKIDRALKEAAAEAHRKKVKLRQAARFWKDPFSPDPEKLLPVQPAPRVDPGGDLSSTRRELAKVKEEAAVARAEAAAAKAEAARANAARARAEANAAYQTALAAKREAEAARASCQDARLAKSSAAPARAPRPRDATRDLPREEGLVTASHHETNLAHKTKVKPETPSRTLTQADPAPPGTGGVGGEAASAAASRGWRNGIVVVPLPPGRY